MVFAIPGGEIAQAVFDRRCRPEADIAHEIVDVGASLRHIARLHLDQLDFGLGTEFLLEKRDDAGNLDRAIVADIVDPPRRVLVPGSSATLATGSASAGPWQSGVPPPR